MTAPSAAGFPPPTPDAPILCVEEGLERLMGDRRLYLQLLGRLRQSYQGAAAQLRQALADGDRAALQRKLHTLKGAAGMVGAQQVYRQAQALELSCHGAGPVCAATLEQLLVALQRLLGMIDSLLEDLDPAPDHAAASATPANARRLVQQLTHLLDDGNGAAIDLLERSASLLAASLGVAVFQEVAAAAHQFEFETALELLQAQRPRT